MIIKANKTITEEIPKSSESIQDTIENIRIKNFHKNSVEAFNRKLENAPAANPNFQDIIRPNDFLSKELKLGLENFKNDPYSDLPIYRPSFFEILGYLRNTESHEFHIIYGLCFLGMYFIFKSEIHNLLDNVIDLIDDTISILVYSVNGEKTEKFRLEKIEHCRNFKILLKKLIILMISMHTFHTILYYLIPLMLWGIVIFGSTLFDLYQSFYSIICYNFNKFFY